ncbi:hypothetical protein HFN89_05620 [Rhizobium laguerreae]|nr:hypothetical protein [Rhizobium laguerreae]
MKHSKAAMSAHHVQFGQMAMMRPTQNSEERPTAPARTYSTQRYAPKGINNGIPIPKQLRDQIETSAQQAAPDEKPQTFLGWGFF